MIDPPRHDAEEHLDALAAMRLADGEPVAPEVAAHAAACEACAALVAAWRREAKALHALFQLDAAEAGTLAQAALPRRLEAQAAVAVRLESLGWIAALCLALAVVLLGWTALAALAVPLLAALGSAGGWGLALGVAASWLPALAQTVWAVVLTLGRLPVVQQPALATAALALLLWVALAARYQLRPFSGEPGPPAPL